MHAQIYKCPCADQIRQSLDRKQPSGHLPDQVNHRNKVRNIFKVNNKNTITTPNGPNASVLWAFFGWENVENSGNTVNFEFNENVQNYSTTYQ